MAKVYLLLLLFLFCNFFTQHTATPTNFKFCRAYFFGAISSIISVFRNPNTLFLKNIFKRTKKQPLEKVAFIGYYNI